MSYLGKISAIVSANTSDFSAKLAASGKEVQSWARSLNSAVNTASSKASSSLRGIYTEAQKAERALQAIQTKKIDFRGFDGQNLGAAVDRMRSLISVTKEVNAPLNQAARSLEKMPAAMQGGFIEAMKTAQRQAEILANDINRMADGSSKLTQSGLEQKFEAIANRAMKTAEAVERLKTAAAAVGSLSTGNELQFRNPEFAAEMARAKGIQAQAAGTTGGDFSAIIQRQSAAANDLATAFARMEESRLTAGGNVKAATAEYERQLALLREVNAELARQQELAANVGASSQRMSTTDATGRSIQDRIRDINAMREAEARLIRDREIAANVGASTQLMSTTDATGRSIQQRLRDIQALEAAERRAAANVGARTNIAFMGASTSIAGMGASTDLADARRRQAAAQRRRLADDFSGGLTGRGAGGINFDIERRSLQGYTEQLRILETTLARASAEARGPAVAAFARLRDYVATAFDEGRIDAAATRTEIQRLTQEAVRAASAATGVRASTLGRQVSRAGDVGRMGLGNASLALNQAAFAIDDFMSSTGGIEFKIRAISNNITQLGFMLGGTFGLFASLGVVIATNVGIAIAKTAGFIEDTKRQEELAKAATDALTSSFENQKSTVESLAEAYRGLAKEIRQSVLTGADKTKADRKAALDGLRQQQEARRREVIAIRSPEIMAIRAERADLETQLGKEPNQGRQLQIRQQIAEGRRIEDRIISETEARASARVQRGDPTLLGNSMIRDAQEQSLANTLATAPPSLRRVGDDFVAGSAADAGTLRFSREVSEVAAGVRQIRDAGMLAASDLAMQLSEILEQRRALASDVADFLPSSTTKTLDSASREIESFASRGAETEEAAAETFDRIFGMMEKTLPQIKGAEFLKKQQEWLDKNQPEALRDFEASVGRGRELTMTPAQRAAEEARRGMDDIRRNFGNMAAEEGNGLIDAAGMGAAMNRFAQEQMRSAAPAIFEMADAVANAVLQGPSRQALEATDVSTVEGSRELNRLLRGDDAAKNVNVVELEKQNQKLTELVTVMKDVAQKMGIVLDL